LADLNGDGRLDVLSGCYDAGEIWWFERRADGTFAEKTALRTDGGKPLKAGDGTSAYASAVAVWDADADGDIDLVVGNIDGEVWLARNDGGPKDPRFAAPVELKTAAGEPIRVCGDAGPCVADWDGDGRLDLLLGAADGSVVWHRNEGDAKNPRLAAAAALLPASEEDADGKHSQPWGIRTKVAVADVDADGRPDLLVGDYSSGPQAEQPADPAETARARAAWRQAFDRLAELGRERARLQADAASQERDARLAALAKELADAEQKLQDAFAASLGGPPGHGYVWLFTRKGGHGAPAK
jgi:hypothetical protein